MIRSLKLLFIIVFFASCIEKKEEVKDKIKEEIKDSSLADNFITCNYYNEIDVIPNFNVSGSINSKNKVNIISEVSGKVYSKNKFKVGQEFKKGKTLIKIAANDLKLEIKSIKSEFLSLLIQCLPDIKIDYSSSFNLWESYVENFNINKRMKSLPNIESKQLRNYLSGRGLYSIFYRIMSLENKLDKFTIKAPFDCIVTQSFLSTGSNVLPGQSLGQIIDRNNYEMSTSVGLSNSELINIGDEAILTISDLNKEISAKIKRKGSHINTLTQSVDIFFDVYDKNIKDGMFVEGIVYGRKIKNVFKIPRDKLINNNLIYHLKDSVIREKKVDIIFFDNDSVIVSGLENIDCLIDDYRSYFFDGMIIN